ncbi:MAG: 4-hydroxy-3-methylbut-2-enyl diphosphate reductase [Bacteroides sp.]|nr:4-hydroxy-3-methylbut-2-enyl diphosphate reductase [Ruminococcus flavefaciens]MCM1555767.1 4-hydroxy-3-methylbut-2-enyl diphosphate reductase [Bacteroides sp.]
MPSIVTIDKNSGFCFGVTRAIEEAQKRLAALQEAGSREPLYCLGEIVHNNEEVKRLEDLGLRVIGKGEFSGLHNARVLIRAHGEPPETYRVAQENHIELVDATCPIVLKLQQRIKAGFEDMQRMGGQVLIYGKPGHAEVIGLNGQTGNRAKVVSSLEDVARMDFSIPTLLYSQTTMNTENYRRIADFVQEACQKNGVYFKAVNSICQSMSRRAEQLEAFAKANDAVVFVSGRQSSNGKYLYEICRRHKPDAFFVSSPNELEPEAFTDGGRARFATIGVCGATSTPMWLMEAVAERLNTLTACI